MPLIHIIHIYITINKSIIFDSSHLLIVLYVKILCIFIFYYLNSRKIIYIKIVYVLECISHQKNSEKSASPNKRVPRAQKAAIGPAHTFQFRPKINFASPLSADLHISCIRALFQQREVKTATAQLCTSAPQFLIFPVRGRGGG